MLKVFKIRSYLLFIAKVFSPIIRKIEPLLFSKAKNNSKYTPIFIVGSPRSGSTVLYQILTHTLDCLYIDNLIYVFFNNLSFGFWLSQKIFGNAGHGSFNSNHGNTSAWHSPSECGGFWYRWFPRTHDFINEGELSEASAGEIRDNISTIMSGYNKNMIFKNLNAGQRIRVLHKIFPNAKFIFIRRDPLYTTQSLFLARQKIGIPDEKWWSVKPYNYEEINKLPIMKKLVSQVYFLEKQITEDLQIIPPENVLEIDYTSYKNEFSNLLAFTGCSKRAELDIESFNFINKKILSEKELKDLTMEVNKFDWSTIGYV